MANTKHRLGMAVHFTERHWSLLDKYLAGELTDREYEEFIQLTASEPEYLRLIRAGISIESLPYDLRWNSAEGFSAVSLRLAAQQTRPFVSVSMGGAASEADGGQVEDHYLPTEFSYPLREGKGSKRSRRLIASKLNLGVWTIVSIVVLALVFVWSSDRWLEKPATAQAISYKEYATLTGQRATVVLPDGSTVVLGPESNLKFSNDFGAGSRSVVLSGMAMFNVVGHSQIPFTVESRHAETRVLGTQFVVRAYEGSSHVDVVVQSGRVSLVSPNSVSPGVIISAGSKGRLHIDGSTRVTEVESESYGAWTEGRLEFEKVPLSDALADVTRWYGVHFSFDNIPIDERWLTASWENEPLSSVLRSLSLALGARYEQEGNRVTFFHNQ